MVIYYELIFIDNVVLNYLVIFLCTKICTVHIKLVKTILVSIISTCITIALISTNNNIIYSLPMKFCLSFLSCISYFGFKEYKKLFKYFFIFTTVCFVVSGSLYYFVLNSMVSTNSLYSVYSNTLLLRVVCGIIFVFFTYRIYIYINKKSINEKRCIERITLSHKKNSIKVNAFFDTGNMLFDAINLLPVVLLSKDKVQKLIDSEATEKVIINVSTINGKSSIIGYKTLDIELENSKHKCIIGIMDSNFEHDCILNPNQFI